MWGTAMVTIGEGASWEELVTASTTPTRQGRFPLRLEKITEIGSFPQTPMPVRERNGKLEVTPAAKRELAAAEAVLQRELRRMLRLTPRKEVFVFVHGYNVSFEKAPLDVAQLWHFLGRQGVPVVFSWPAGHGGGLIRGYIHDTESGIFSVFHLKQFLKAIAKMPEVQQIHLLAHSRGSSVLTDAVREIALQQQANQKKHSKAGHLVLLSPDIDIDVAGQRLVAEPIEDQAKHVTIYSTQDDKAITASIKLLSSRGRIGKLNPEDLSDEQRERMGRMSGVSLIHSDLKGDFLGHSDFLSRPEVSSDLILLLRDGREPGAKYGRPLRKYSPNFWVVPKGYPFQQR
jgi:esterase/lipase superfamily enzyme